MWLLLTVFVDFLWLISFSCIQLLAYQQWPVILMYMHVVVIFVFRKHIKPKLRTTQKVP